MKIKLLAVALLTLSFLICGCAAPNQIMVNPSNGAAVDCSTWGWGWAGTPMALIAHERCIERYRSVGFVTAEEYKTSGKTFNVSNTEPARLIITSNPPGARIYVGATAQELKLMKFPTPVNLKHPKGGQLWAAECTRVELDGYEKSEVKCLPLGAGDRIIHFDLKPLSQAGDASK